MNIFSRICALAAVIISIISYIDIRIERGKARAAEEKRLALMQQEAEHDWRAFEEP